MPLPAGRNVLAMRGDPPEDNPNYKPGPDEPHFGHELVSVIREHGNVVACGHLDLRQSGSLRPGRAEGAALGDETERGEVRK